MKEFVLTAGDGQNYRAPPLQALNQGRIGGYITGMEADNHVGPASRNRRAFINLKIGYVPYSK